MAHRGGSYGRGENGGRGNGDTSGGVYNCFTNLESIDRSPGDDQSSPFFLSNSDNPSFILISSHLIGNNYNSWNQAMTMVLIAKK